MAKTTKTNSNTNGTVSAPAKAVVAKTEPVKAVVAAPQPAKPITPKVEPAKTPVLQPTVSLELVKPGAKQVAVAGSFNDWKPERTPLAQIGNGRWVGDLAVKPGRHEYLFVV